MDRRLEPVVTAVDINGNPLPAGMVRREDAPSPADLLNSCPGSNTKSSLERADGCDFNTDADQSGVAAPYKKTHRLSDPVYNCENGGTVQQTLGGSTTFTREWSITITESVDFPGISSSWSVGTTNSNSQSVDRSDTITVPNGKKGAVGAEQYFKQTKGSVFIHYGDKQAGHYYWTVSNVMVNAPDGDAIPTAQVIDCSSEFQWDS